VRAFARGVVALALALMLSPGCGGAPPPTPERVVLPPVEPTIVPSLPALASRAGLASVVFVRPAELASTPGFLSGVASVLTPERLTRYRLVTGIDLTRTREVLVATYGAGPSESTLYLLRVAERPADVERLFRERLTRDARREADHPDVVRLWGKVGVRTVGFVRLGADVVGFQEGGDMERGAMRVATLYALGRLRRAPTLLREGPVAELHHAFADAPFIYLVTGGVDLAVPGAATQLGEVATAWGFAARPTTNGTALVRARVTGDFAQENEAAAQELVALWQSLATSDLGQSLGLDAPTAPPRPIATPEAVGLEVELALPRLVAGLAKHAPSGP
jgi:hypothetical protein